jgi:uncharacterized protein
MAFEINLRHLDKGPLYLKGELPAEELDIDTMDEIISLSKPLTYDLCVELLDNSILVQGNLELALDCQCVRCLKAFNYRLKIDAWVAHLPLEGEESAKIINDCVDLTPFIRDDILLAFPQHPLCEPECKGLPRPKTAGRAKKHDSSLGSPAWVELNKLKLK